MPTFTTTFEQSLQRKNRENRIHTINTQIDRKYSKRLNFWLCLFFGFSVYECSRMGFEYFNVGFFRIC